MSSRLQKQALGVINVCKTALAGKGKDHQPGVDNQTIAIAQVILAEAKAAVPDDKVLAAVQLDPPVSFWTSVQTAMETVASSIPTDEEANLVDILNKGRERAAKSGG